MVKKNHVGVLSFFVYSLGGEREKFASQGGENPPPRKPRGWDNREEAWRSLWLPIQWQGERKSGEPEKGACSTRGGEQEGESQWVQIKLIYNKSDKGTWLGVSIF